MSQEQAACSMLLVLPLKSRQMCDTLVDQSAISSVLFECILLRCVVQFTCGAVEVCSVVHVGSGVQVCNGRQGQECTGPAAHEWRLLKCVEARQGVGQAPGLPLLHLPQDQQQQHP